MRRIEWKRIPKTIWHALKRICRGIRAHREGVKTAAIIVLTALLVMQGGMLAHRAAEDGSTVQRSDTQQELVDNSAAAFPIRFAVRYDNKMYGLEYSASGMSEVFHATTDVWAQAWSNAEQPIRATHESYRSALAKDDLMLMEYDGSIPLRLAAGWVGAQMQDAWKDVMLGTASICRDEVGYTVYFRDNSTGKLLCARTEVDDNVFDSAAAQYDENDCKIAASQKDSAVSPDTLYFPGGETFEVMSFADYDGTNGLQALLTAFHMDAKNALDAEYSADNARIFVSGRDTLQLKNTGEVSYDGSSIRITASDSSNRELQYVQCGYTLAQGALDAIGSGAAPALTNAYFDDNGDYIAVFGMQIGGIPADNKDTGYFARFTFHGTTMCAAELALRTTQTTGETIAVMPERQVSAALTSSVNAVLSLRYIDRPSKKRTDDSMLTADSLFGKDSVLTIDDAQDGQGETINSSSDLQTAWYDTTGTAVSPEWYIIRFSQNTELPDVASQPDELELVYADFDAMIQEGGAR